MQNIDILTIKQLMQNPTGKFSAYMARRDKTIEDMNNRYYNLLNKSKKFTFKIYKIKKDFLFHFFIPSEEFPHNIYYDVAILFCYNDEVANQTTINNYTLKLFSNSPNFMFTYTYALNQNDMLIPFLKSKCSRLALTQPPSLRNPIEVYGFEKSVYFACKYIMDNNLNNIFELEGNRYNYSESAFKNSIASQENKYEENKRVKKAIAEKKKQEKIESKLNKNNVSDVKEYKTKANKPSIVKNKTVKKTSKVSSVVRKKKK